jgi:hypothetical protein
MTARVRINGAERNGTGVLDGFQVVASIALPNKSSGQLCL